MRPAILHQLVAALFASLAIACNNTDNSSGGPYPTNSVSTATLVHRSPSDSSLGSLLPSTSTTLAAPPNDTTTNITTTSTPSGWVLIIKICIHIFEIFSTLCMMSHQGHKLALAVFSEVRGEQYRFERLVQRMRELADEEQKDQSVAWECQEAGIQLFNAFASSPETIETRRSIRGELERRGLDDHLKVKFNHVDESLLPCILIYVWGLLFSFRNWRKSMHQNRARMPFACTSRAKTLILS